MIQTCCGWVEMSLCFWIHCMQNFIMHDRGLALRMTFLYWILPFPCNMDYLSCVMTSSCQLYSHLYSRSFTPMVTWLQKEVCHLGGREDKGGTSPGKLSVKREKQCRGPPVSMGDLFSDPLCIPFSVDGESPQRTFQMQPEEPSYCNGRIPDMLGGCIPQVTSWAQLEDPSDQVLEVLEGLLMSGQHSGCVKSTGAKLVE